MAEGRLAVIAAGGTGGHMFPAQALAEALLARGWQVVLSTDARGARYATGFPAEVDVQRVPAASFAQAGGLARALVPFRLIGGVGAALAQFRRRAPAVVVGFGGYPSIPALLAAWLLRLPRMIHEQNGVLGQVNRVFARRVQALACGIWPTALPAGAAGTHTGNPVRAAVLARAAAPYIPPGDYPMSLLVTGGSQGAGAFADFVPSAVALLPKTIRRHLRVAQQARPEDVERVAAAYAEIGVPCEVEPFFDDIAGRLSEAQLVVCRAGASTLADLTVIGRPAILIPYPFATADHQTANARACAEAGAAIVMPQDTLTPELLSAEIAHVLGDGELALRMSLAAVRAGRPDATERLVALVEDVAEERRPT